MDNKKIFGARLKAARMNAGLTQQDLIQKMDDGLSRGLLSKYERGENTPRRKRLERFAYLLGVPEAFLLGVENDSKKSTPLEKLTKMGIEIDEIVREFRLLNKLADHITGEKTLDAPLDAICEPFGFEPELFEEVRQLDKLKIARAMAEKSNAAKAILTLFNLRSEEYEEMNRWIREADHKKPPTNKAEGESVSPTLEKAEPRAAGKIGSRRPSRGAGSDDENAV